MKPWLLLALIWTLTSIGVVLLLRHAWRQLRTTRAENRQWQRCAEGDHLDTLDTKVDGLPKLAWRCVNCGAREVLGTAFATGTNKTTRRSKR